MVLVVLLWLTVVVPDEPEVLPPVLVVVFVPAPDVVTLVVGVLPTPPGPPFVGTLEEPPANEFPVPIHVPQKAC